MVLSMATTRKGCSRQATTKNANLNCLISAPIESKNCHVINILAAILQSGIGWLQASLVLSTSGLTMRLAYKQTFTILSSLDSHNLTKHQAAQLLEDIRPM